MTKTSGTAVAQAARPSTGASTAHTRPPFSNRLRSGLAFDRIGAVYVWLGIIVVFTLWAPETFPNIGTAKQILNSNAITGLAALSITIPLAARVFDLSFAYIMTLTGVAVAHCIVDGMRRMRALAIGVSIGVGMGGINAAV